MKNEGCAPAVHPVDCVVGSIRSHSSCRQPFPGIHGCALRTSHFPDFEVQDGIGVGLASDMAEEGAAVDGLAFLDRTIAQVGVNRAVAAVGDDDAGACAGQVKPA